MSLQLDYSVLLKRFALVLTLVFMTYNPLGLSYIAWLNSIIFGDASLFSPPFILFTLLIGICWFFYIQYTYSALGKIPSIFALLFAAIFLWWLIDLGFFQLSIIPIFSYIVLILISMILTLAMSWSHLRQYWAELFDINHPK